MEADSLQQEQGLPDVFVHYDTPPRDDPDAMKDYKLTHDLQTGLLNEPGRNEVLSYLESSMPGNFAMLSFDLDKFKAVNTAQGRSGGNKTLKAAADAIDAIRGTLRTDQAESHPDRRRSSVASVPDLVATRPHGDEFDILLPGVGTKEDADVVAERIIGNLEATGIKASFGSAVHEEGMDTEKLLERSDSNLRLAKIRKRVKAFEQQPGYKRILSRLGTFCIRRAGVLPPDFDPRDY